MTILVTFGVLAEIDWPFQGDNEDPNWRWLDQHANFSHREACEFIIHIGNDKIQDGLSEYARGQIQNMQMHGCTTEFIAAYEAAARSGALRVLFYYNG